MKIYSHYQYMYKGFQLTTICVCSTKKKAKEILGKSEYMMNNWVYCSDYLKNNELKEETLYFMFDQYGGEVRYFLSKEDINKKYSLSEIQNIKDNHRKEYPTYHHLMLKINKTN